MDVHPLAGLFIMFMLYCPMQPWIVVLAALSCPSMQL